MTELEVGDYICDSARKVWTVRLEDTDVGDNYFDCETQFEAEVISSLVKRRFAEVKLEKVREVRDKILKILDAFLGKTIHPTLLKVVELLIEGEFKELIEE